LEINLTEAQKLTVERRCLEAVRISEEIHEKMVPSEGLRDELVGTRGDKWTALILGIFSGVLSLVVWRWLFNTFHIDEFLAGFGLPYLIASNLPELLAMKAAAFASWLGTYSWGVEGRVHYVNQAFNAHDRSSVLHSVCEELAEILPGAIPDLSDYSHNYDDDRPNSLVEIALGRRVEVNRRPSPRRREPPLSAN
jgi:hypothetical protein